MRLGDRRVVRRLAGILVSKKTDKTGNKVGPPVSVTSVTFPTPHLKFPEPPKVVPPARDQF